jgi:hypothetical protein
MQALPKVLSVAERNDLSLNLLTVALDDKAEAVQRMQQKYAIESPIAMMQTSAKLPMDFGVAINRWTWQLPALVLIRPDGEVALIDIGGIDADHIGQTILCMMSCKADEVLK